MKTWHSYLECNHEYNYSCRYTSLINNKTWQHCFICIQNYLPLDRDVALYLNKLESTAPVPRMLCANFVETGPAILEKKIFKFSQCIFAIKSNYLPFENGLAPYLNKFESPSPKDALCAKFGWNWFGGSWEKDLKILSMYFWYYEFLKLAQLFLRRR